MSQSDDEGRSESSPYGQGSTAGGSQHEQPQYGQQQPYGQPTPYEQPQYGQSPYGQPSPYGQQYDPASPYGQQQYDQQQYGQAPYGQYGPYGQSAVPARPGGVVTAAVLGFIYGAFGVLVALAFIVFGAAASGASRGDAQEILGLGEFAGAVGGVLIVLGVATLAWTVVMIWGSVWALTGRSRVLLIVGGSIALAFTLLGFLSNLGGNGSGSDVFWSLLFVLGALAIVVLLSIGPAASFYAAHRARRGR
jgi:hypothetical protein